MSAKKRSREEKKLTVDNNKSSGNLHIVPITKNYVEEFLGNIQKVNQSIQNGEPGCSFLLEQTHSILAEANEFSEQFVLAAKQNGLVASMIQLLLKPSLLLAKLELLCTVLAMLASADVEVYNSLLRADVITVLISYFTLQNANSKEILAVAQFLELLLEDNGAMLNIADDVSKRNLFSFARVPGSEAALCAAGAMQEASIEERDAVVSIHFEQVSAQECTEDYIFKFFKVLTNYYSEECPSGVVEKLASLLLDVKPELYEKPSAALTNLMANMVSGMAEAHLMRFEPVFENAFDGLGKNNEDLEFVESVSNLMRALSLTGIWAAEPEDIMLLSEHPESVTVLFNLVPICYYALKHQFSPQEQLSNVHGLLSSLANRTDVPEVREEALEEFNKLNIH